MDTFETRVTALGFDDKTEFSINEFAMLAGLSRVWVRRALTKGKKAGSKKSVSVTTPLRSMSDLPSSSTHLVDKWFISIDTARAWYGEVKDKQELKELRYTDPTAYAQRSRPSERAIALVNRKVAADTELTPEQKELISDRLNAYLADYQKAYEERQAKK